ncbi:hypothetical protein [Streptomyces caniferus]|uniref:hypothetical protein n=1 Tax=Streptomyces caniferus TaxID=285557 RepID=UPI0037F843EC
MATARRSGSTPTGNSRSWCGHELLGIPQYAALCQESAGRPVGHAVTGGHGPISWVASYEEG